MGSRHLPEEAVAGPRGPASATIAPDDDSLAWVRLVLDAPDRSGDEERKDVRAELDRELDRLKSEFHASVSDELRTPLTSILGFALTLLQRWPDLDDSLRLEFVQRIARRAEDLRLLIDRLLNFS